MGVEAQGQQDLSPSPSAVTPAPEDEARPKVSRFRLRDGVQILGIALLLALGLRTFVLEGFRIPSESMERSLLVGDFVLVSKLRYGPRLPRTIGIPLTDWYLKDVELPHVRLPGFAQPRRGEAVVFNYPAGNAPVDRRLHYIKRLVGLPGDSVALHGKKLYVNGVYEPPGEMMQQRWVAQTAPGSIFPIDSLRALGASQIAILEREQGQVAFEATASLAGGVASWQGVTTVAPYVQARMPSPGPRVFPSGSVFSRDHYGPVYVPARGDTLTLSAATWPLYRDLIQRYEHHQAQMVTGDRFLIDSVETKHYVVGQDYYFVLGDNRDSSIDSRAWGFVPKDHLVGKAVVIYFSWDAVERKVRLDRLLTKIR